MEGWKERKVKGTDKRKTEAKTGKRKREEENYNN